MEEVLGIVGCCAVIDGMGHHTIALSERFCRTFQGVSRVWMRKLSIWIASASKKTGCGCRMATEQPKGFHVFEGLESEGIQSNRGMGLGMPGRSEEAEFLQMDGLLSA